MPVYLHILLNVWTSFSILLFYILCFVFIVNTCLISTNSSSATNYQKRWNCSCIYMKQINVLIRWLDEISLVKQKMNLLIVFWWHKLSRSISRQSVILLVVLRWRYSSWCMRASSIQRSSLESLNTSPQFFINFQHCHIIIVSSGLLTTHRGFFLGPGCHISFPLVEFYFTPCLLYNL